MMRFLAILFLASAGMAAPIGFNNQPLYGLANWWSFNESSGTIAFPSAGVLTGTNASAVWTNGVVGMAAYCGNSSAFNFGDILPLNASNFTVSVWIKTTATADSVQGIFTKTKAAGVDGRWAIFRDTGQQIVLLISLTPTTGATILTPVQSYTNGLWHQITATINRQTPVFTLYIDGVNKGTNTSTVSTGTSALNVYVGCYPNGAGAAANFFNGSIDDARYYNRCLTAEEVVTLYNGGAATHQ